jgi:hypothetical protein
MYKTMAAWLLGLAIALPASALAASKDEKRQDIRDVTQNTLDRLYKAQPKAKEAIDRSAGYAVFSNFGMKILFAGGGSGAANRVNRKTQADNLHEDVEVHGGSSGIGVKKVPAACGCSRSSPTRRLHQQGLESSAARRRRSGSDGQRAGAYAGAMSIKPASGCTS